jgi:trehalose 6-phosphate synthase/phosphatase
VVNPYDAEEVAHAIAKALAMPAPEQAWRLAAMQDRLRGSDVRTWPSHFLSRLDAMHRMTKDLAIRIPGPRDITGFRQAYRSAERRCLVLDYDGTLVPFARDRTTAGPDGRVLDTLKVLGSAEGNNVVLISGRPRSDLDRWFGSLPMTLIAEHGGWVRRPDGAWEPALSPDDRWKDRVRPILDQFAERIPGSSVEEKDFSLSWHYRTADSDTGAKGAKDLSEILTLFTANPDLHILPGSKVIEVRRRGVDKGTYFSTDLAKERWDFLLAAGDDWTDESLFQVLPAEAISIRVGLHPTAARFNVERPEDLVAILEAIAK